MDNIEQNKQIWIKIENQGEIDTNGLHLMGVSNKREEEKIGFFGSGNKYAIALLLREEIPFKIFSGKKEIVIETEPVMFRGQLFDQIIVDSEKTSLTTSMGVDWETWFAIREIYCNALDEGEASIGITKTINPIQGKTTVYVQLTSKLSKFFKNINEFILTSKTPDLELKTHWGQVDIHSTDGNKFICYRKGIRIYPENKEKSLYWYNFHKIDINESRTYKYEHQIKEQIASALAVTQDREVILNFIKNWKGTYEEYIYWEDDYCIDKLSSTWHDILKGKRIYPEGIAITSGDFEAKINSFIVPDKLADKIATEIPNCEVIGKKKDKDFSKINPTNEQQEKITKAVKELANIGYEVTSKIEVVIPSIDDVIAWYEKENDMIYLSEKYLTTIREIKNTILEEHFHSKGHADGQREFVTFLIDELIRLKELRQLK